MSISSHARSAISNAATRSNALGRKGVQLVSTLCAGREVDHRHDKRQRRSLAAAWMPLRQLQRGSWAAYDSSSSSARAI